MHLTIKIAATRTKPAYAGYKTPDFRLVRAGGLGLFSRDFNRSGGRYPICNVFKYVTVRR